MLLNNISLLRTAVILYLSCFAVFILFTRQPDYFDGDFTAGVVVNVDTVPRAMLQKHAVQPGDRPVVQFSEGHDTYLYNGKDNFFQQSYKAGDKVRVILDPGNPANANIYSFWGYWIRAQELTFTLIGFIILFGIAVGITGRNRNVSDIEVDANGHMRYN